MKNWVQTLQSTQSFVMTWQKWWKEPVASAVHQDALPALVKTKMFQDLHALSQQYSGTRVLFNILPPRSLTCKPFSFDYYFALNLFCRSGNSFSDLMPDQLDFVHKLMKDSDAYKRKFPLYAALFLSLLVLLADKKLMLCCLNQVDLLKVLSIS